MLAPRHGFAVIGGDGRRPVGRLVRRAVLATWLVAHAAAPSGFGQATLANLSFEDLSRIEVYSGTLTATPSRLIPAWTTSLDELTIQRSGARALNELLEIHAPNTQLLAHISLQDHFGIRGIISDRDDKYLLRLNGRVMNNHFLFGAENERDLPLLGDFREVTLVHGPGSATYGAGALAGVLNLETHTGLTFQGADAQFRQGWRDRFSAGEVRFGHRLSDQSGLFFYAGVADQPGADPGAAPYVFGKSFAMRGEIPDVVAGQPTPFAVVNLHDQGQHPRLKFHGSLVQGPLEIWARFTQTGGVMRPIRTVLQRLDTLDPPPFRGGESRQFTLATRYRQELRPTLQLDLSGSYDWYRHDYHLPDLYPSPLERDEHEVYASALLTWSPTGEQSLAAGWDYSHEWFDGPRISVPAIPDTWQTDTLSFLLEHQIRWNDVWTTFLSGRADKQTYTDWLLSPRLAVTATPTAEDTFKLIAAQATRRNGDGELREEHVLSGTKGDTESLRSLEARYDRQVGENLQLGLGAFAQRSEAIGYDTAAERSIAIGVFQIWGLEAVLSWRSADTRLMLSHGFTRLLSADLAHPETIQGISAAPYGFGSDLANWSNHLTKVAVIQELGERWSASTSLRVYWGFPGMEDLANWNATQAPPRNLALADPGYDDPYGPSVFWNAGLEFRPTRSLLLRLDAFNILGWVDQTLNKRLILYRGSDYSAEAAALSFLVRWTY